MFLKLSIHIVWNEGNNEITGVIPNSFGKLKNLESLRLGMCMESILNLLIVNNDFLTLS